jgi:1-acyl-sn-glycerol-3-phosphate acyltransferase
LIRTAWTLLGSLVITFLMAGRVVVASWLPSYPRMTCLCDRSGRIWADVILRCAGARVRVEAPEGMDWDRPFVVVANHQSWFDVFALMAHLPARARFVAKEELGWVPIFGRAWKTCGHVSVDRSDRAGAVSSLEAAGRRVRDERLAMILFPEGTRSPDGSLMRFKKGAFVLAIQTGVPLLPVGIEGSRRIMPKGSYRIRSGEIVLRVGEPIPVEGLTLRDRDRLLEEGRHRIATLMGGAADHRPAGETDPSPPEPSRRGSAAGSDTPIGETIE